MPAHPGAVLHIEHITSRNTRPGDPGTPIDGGE